MSELSELARRLLTEGAAKVVIGYEEGRRGVRPAFIRRPEDADRLLFDERCVQNLAAYLSPRRRNVAALGKPAVVIKTCDARAVAAMLREAQLKREDLVLIGVRCGGVLAEPDARGPLTSASLADRCSACATLEPTLFDHLVGEPHPTPPTRTDRRERLTALLAKPSAERLAFWQAEFTKCTLCRACRQICPLCFCDRCLADKTEPQWLESSPHPRAVLAWHLTRAMHFAGRCAGCNECERACPAGIPLGLITQHAADIMATRFGHEMNDNPEIAAPIGCYRTDDQQEFIR